MTFTVVMPAYNVEAFLPESLANLRAQSFTDWEAVVVDDGSTDGTLARAREIAAVDPRIRVVSQPNGGVSRARNRGLAEAKGDWIIWLDADDAYVDGALDRIASLIAEHPDCACLQFPYLALDPETGSRTPCVPRAYSEFGGRSYSGAEAFELLYSRRGVAGQNWQPWRFAYRRDVLPRFRDGVIHEDVDVLPLHMSALERVFIARDPLYIYRLAHAGATTATFTPRRVRDILGVVDHLSDELNRTSLPASSVRGFRSMIAFNLFGYFLASAGFPDPDRTELLAAFAARRAWLLAISWPPRTAWLKRLLLRVLGVRLTGRLIGWLTSYHGFHKLTPR